MDNWVAFTILGILSLSVVVSVCGWFVWYSNRDGDGDVVSYRRGWSMLVGGGWQQLEL